MRRTEPLLDIQHLAVRITDQQELRPVDDVSLHIDAGEAVALVGESGSGKSMTALSTIRLEPRAASIEAGQIRFAGRDLAKTDERELRQLRGNEIGMIFQDPMTFLNPLMPVGTQLVEGLAAHRKLSWATAWDAGVEALRKVRIPDAAAIMKRYPHQLSGGMRQRVIIAMAILCRPKLLIADEPTTALDVTVQAQIMTLITELRRELGVALLLITHDLGLVGSHCDRVYVMYAGQIVEEGPVAEIFARPRHPYTQGLLRSVLPLDRRSADFPMIKGQPPNLAALPGGCRFHPRCEKRLASCDRRAPAVVASDRGFVRCALYERISV